jgi:hypothetical protein
MKDGSGALVDTANEAPRSLLAGDQPILLMQENFHRIRVDVLFPSFLRSSRSLSRGKGRLVLMIQTQVTQVKRRNLVSLKFLWKNSNSNRPLT